jgi:hypothetical protein
MKAIAIIAAALALAGCGAAGGDDGRKAAIQKKLDAKPTAVYV